MDAFATVDDYEARYGEVDDPDVLKQVLEDATRAISCELDRAGIDYSEPSESYAERLMQACRSAANRAMSCGDGGAAPVGATQYSLGANGYTESYSLSNPYGEVYLTKTERKLLGIGVQRIGSIRAAIGECDA